MALAVRSRKPKTLALSVALATRQARKHVDAIMPGVMATVESKLSHDLTTDTPTVVTTITFPFAHVRAYDLGVALESLPKSKVAPGSGRYTITRTR